MRDIAHWGCLILIIKFEFRNLIFMSISRRLFGIFGIFSASGKTLIIVFDRAGIIIKLFKIGLILVCRLQSLSLINGCIDTVQAIRFNWIISLILVIITAITIFLIPSPAFLCVVLRLSICLQLALWLQISYIAVAGWGVALRGRRSSWRIVQLFFLYHFFQMGIVPLRNWLLFVRLFDWIFHWNLLTI